MNPSPFETRSTPTGRPGPRSTTPHSATPLPESAGRSRRLPRWAVATIAVLVALPALGVLLAVAAAVVVPAFLDQRGGAVETSLTADLRAVGAAEEAFRAGSGTYTADPALLDVAPPANETAILRADAGAFCAVARHAATRTVLYLDQTGAVRAEPCG